MINALLRSVHFLVLASWFCFWPALAVGLLAYAIDPEWGVIAFITVFSGLLTQFLFARKRNWLS